MCNVQMKADALLPAFIGSFPSYQVFIRQHTRSCLTFFGNKAKIWMLDVLPEIPTPSSLTWQPLCLPCNGSLVYYYFLYWNSNYDKDSETSICIDTYFARQQECSPHFTVCDPVKSWAVKQ